MKVLYISNWSIHDPLTISSVMPTLKALKRYIGSERLTLVTIERKNARFPNYEIPYDFVDHIPLTPWAQWNFVATKSYESLLLPRIIERTCRERSVDLLFARCSPAGAIACKIHERTGIPFVVESFEPHSEYMVHCGDWPRGGWKYQYARRFEKKQMQKAKLLITVARSYRDYLVANEGVESSRVAVIPCVTDLEQTKFDPERRRVLREELGFGHATTAIYAGKFGGLYYDEEAFRVMRDAFDYFPDFRLILLTPTDGAHVRGRLAAAGVPEDRVCVRQVPRHEIPGYLSVADFAYSFHRPNPSSRFLCPIKHGEYWACGLPFIAPDGVGDDCKIIETEGGGANLDPLLSNRRHCHETLDRIIARPGYRTAIRELAVRHKGAGLIDGVLSTLFEDTGLGLS
jgi:hypothetical protein